MNIRLIVLLIFVFQFSSESMKNTPYSKNNISIKDANWVVSYILNSQKNKDDVLNDLHTNNAKPNVIHYIRLAYSFLEKYYFNLKETKTRITSSDFLKRIQNERSKQLKIQSLESLSRDIFNFNGNKQQLLNALNTQYKEFEKLYKRIIYNYIASSEEYLSLTTTANDLLASSNFPPIVKNAFSEQLKIQSLESLSRDILALDDNEELLSKLCKANLKKEFDALQTLVEYSYIFCSAEYLSVTNLLQYYYLTDDLQKSIGLLLYTGKSYDIYKSNIKSYLQSAAKNLTCILNDIENQECIDAIISRFTNYKSPPENKENMEMESDSMKNIMKMSDKNRMYMIKQVNYIPNYLRTVICQKLHIDISQEEEQYKKTRAIFIDRYLLSINKHIKNITDFSNDSESQFEKNFT